MAMFIWRLMTGIHVWLYRVSKGAIGAKFRDFNVLLLKTTGRKSGIERTAPLGYFRDGDAYVVVASNAGKENHPAWYLNLQTNSRAEIQVGDKLMTVHAETAAGEYRQRLWEQVLREAPSYGAYTKGLSREIPIVVLRETS